MAQNSMTDLQGNPINPIRSSIKQAARNEAVLKLLNGVDLDEVIGGLKLAKTLAGVLQAQRIVNTMNHVKKLKKLIMEGE